ncbi:hypothetical protein B0H13DRAFT_2318448 [Mycena leptocephala]|nr:hypothetical protein B0H13DRAFT_2318448 [Mycena leptocephala]
MVIGRAASLSTPEYFDVADCLAKRIQEQEATCMIDEPVNDYHESNDPDPLPFWINPSPSSPPPPPPPCNSPFLVSFKTLLTVKTLVSHDELWLREDVSERLQILSADWQDIVLKMNERANEPQEEEEEDRFDLDENNGRSVLTTPILETSQDAWEPELSERTLSSHLVLLLRDKEIREAVAVPLVTLATLTTLQHRPQVHRDRAGMEVLMGVVGAEGEMEVEAAGQEAPVHLDLQFLQAPVHLDLRFLQEDSARLDLPVHQDLQARKGIPDPLDRQEEEEEERLWLQIRIGLYLHMDWWSLR